MFKIEAEFDAMKIVKLLDEFSFKFSSIEGKTKQFVGILSSVIFQDVMDHFDKQQGSDGHWQKWSESYQKRMSKLGKGQNRILQDKGRLRQNFNPSKWRTSGDYIIWYNNAKTKKGFPYAYAHNEGGPKLPKRDFMWLSSQAVIEIGYQVNRMLES